MDVAYQYLTFFLDDDEEVEKIANDYRKGELLTGELKKKCIAVLQKVVSNFQEKKKAVSDDLVRQFMDKERKIDPTMAERGETAKRQKELVGETAVASTDA